ncbi:MAG: hypothetical protein FRX49_06587 [Trebouxia sp. A1-2]|nr:MAG: hypothetical protein FRX49_06587 [Trebouxia sp. A1-2]
MEGSMSGHLFELVLSRLHEGGVMSSPTVAAAAMLSPLAFTTFSPSSKDRTPANTKAQYSPRLKPADKGPDLVQHRHRHLYRPGGIVKMGAMKVADVC